MNRTATTTLIALVCTTLILAVLGEWWWRVGLSVLIGWFGLAAIVVVCLNAKMGGGPEAEERAAERNRTPPPSPSFEVQQARIKQLERMLNDLRAGDGETTCSTE